MSGTNVSANRSAQGSRMRWYVLIAAVITMMATANLQFSWTLFTVPLKAHFKTSLAAVQVAFTLFVLAQTWLMPFEAFFVDKLGPRVVVSIGGLLVGISWVGSGMAQSLTGLYVAYFIGGIGAGAVYGAAIGTMMKWFPDRRGLAVGIVTGAFGSGTVFTILPISRMIETAGYNSAFITFGVIQGIVVVLAAQFLKVPEVDWRPAGWEALQGKIKHKVLQSTKDYTPAEMLKTGTFYVLYLMMTMVAFGGLTVTAQLKPIGVSYGFDKVFLITGLSVVNLALLLDRVVHGFTRPFWGWLSDQIGRYNVMGIAFTMEGIAVILLTLFVHRPLLFVILSGLSFFAWGEIYSLFPTAIADIFGPKYATTNYGIQYTAKGTASILAGPGAAMLMAAGGSWLPVLWTAAIFDLTAAALAVLWLRPLVTKLLQSRTGGTVGQAAAALQPGDD